MSTIISASKSQELFCTLCSKEISSVQQKKIFHADDRVQHIFHSVCAESWLKSNSSCPACHTVEIVAIKSNLVIDNIDFLQLQALGKKKSLNDKTD